MNRHPNQAYPRVPSHSIYQYDDHSYQPRHEGVVRAPQQTWHVEQLLRQENAQLCQQNTELQQQLEQARSSRLTRHDVDGIIRQWHDHCKYLKGQLDQNVAANQNLHGKVNAFCHENEDLKAQLHDLRAVARVTASSTTSFGSFQPGYMPDVVEAHVNDLAQCARILAKGLLRLLGHRTLHKPLVSWLSPDEVSGPGAVCALQHTVLHSLWSGLWRAAGTGGGHAAARSEQQLCFDRCVLLALQTEAAGAELTDAALEVQQVFYRHQFLQAKAMTAEHEAEVFGESAETVLDDVAFKAYSGLPVTGRTWPDALLAAAVKTVHSAATLMFLVKAADPKLELFLTTHAPSAKVTPPLPSPLSSSSTSSADRLKPQQLKTAAAAAAAAAAASPAVAVEFDEAVHHCVRGEPAAPPGLPRDVVKFSMAPGVRYQALFGGGAEERGVLVKEGVYKLMGVTKEEEGEEEEGGVGSSDSEPIEAN